MSVHDWVLGWCGLAVFGACHGASGSTTTVDSDGGDPTGTTATSAGSTHAGETATTSPTSSTSTTDGGSSSSTTADPTTSTTRPGTTSGSASSTGGTSATGGNEVCDEWVVHVGDLWITDDTDLASLVCIVEVTGSVHVEGTTALTSFGTLSNLATVGEDVFVLDNAALVDLAGLSGLKNMVGSPSATIAIHNNPALVDISGLSALEIVDSVSIVDCDALTDLTGLQGPIVGNLQKGWYLTVAANDGLTDLGGLADLQGFSGQLMIENNAALEDISALEFVLDPAGLAGIYVVDNPVLVDLVGLEAVTQVGELQLFNNDALTSMHGLEGLVESTNDIYIVGHDNLTTTAGLEALQKVVTLQIFDNKALSSLAGLSGLSTVSQVLAIGSCESGGSDALVDLHGLENLQTAWALTISNNSALTSLAGLEGLESVELLFIVNNTALPTATAEALAAKFNTMNTVLCNNMGAPEMCPC